MSDNENNEMYKDISSLITAEILKTRKKDPGKYIGDGPPKVLKERMQERKKMLDFKENEDVVNQKKEWSDFIKRFLIFQYIVIVIVLGVNGFRFLGFYLSDGVMYGLLGATILQSFYLTRIIFGHLYTSRNKMHIEDM